MRANSKTLVLLILILLIACVEAASAQNPAPSDPADTRIPRDSKVYIVPADGFEQYLAAAFRKKSVPLLIVTDRDAADFEITTTHEKKNASFAQIFVWGIIQPMATASIQIVNLKTKVVVFADSSFRIAALKGERSTAEKLAKYLRRRMEKDEKKAAMNKRAATSRPLSLLVPVESRLEFLRVVLDLAL